MISITTVLIVSLVLGLSWYFVGVGKRKKSPPGPWGLPIFGNLFSLEPQLHRSFEKWGQEYGPIVSVKFGTVHAVILDDIKVIREAFNMPAFTGRPDLKFFNFLSGGKHGILNSDGVEWVEQRRFTLRTLRDFGFGKKSMESLIMDEVNEVLVWMGANEGKPVSVNRKFSLAVVNSLFAIMTGKRYDHEDPILKGVLDAATETFGELSQSGILWFFPQLAILLPKYFGWDKLVLVANKFTKFFKDIVDDHVSAMAKGEAHGSTDFTYSYLEEVEKTTDPSSSFYKETGKNTLVTVLTDLYGAGSGTTTTTLAWLILYLITNPEVQAKLQEELDEVTGKSRKPCLADRPRTPYAEAVIQETLRFSSITPWSVFHGTTEDVELQGYTIPKDTLIIPNLHAVHHNKGIWGDPENFRPERFLSADGKTVTKSDALIPFSVGKRVCVGETFARDQLYLFLTNIFQHFQAVPDPANPKLDLTPDGAFVLEPKPYTVVFKDRLNA